MVILLAPPGLQWLAGKIVGIGFVLFHQSTIRYLIQLCHYPALLPTQQPNFKMLSCDAGHYTEVLSDRWRNVGKPKYRWSSMMIPQQLFESIIKHSKKRKRRCYNGRGMPGCIWGWLSGHQQVWSLCLSLIVLFTTCNYVKFLIINLNHIMNAGFSHQ